MKKIIKILFAILNVMLAMVLLMTTLAAVVAPSQSTLISLSGYGYPILLAINVLCVLVWLCFKSKYFLISLIAILIRVNFLPLFLQFCGTEESTEESTLKFMTFNTHGFKGVDGDRDADSCAAVFLGMLKEESPDLVSMQEFSLNKCWIDSLEQMGYKYHYSARERGYGENLYSRLPLDYVGSFGNGGMLYVDVEFEGQMIRVICVHMASYQMVESDAEALESLAHGEVDSVTKVPLKKLQVTMLAHEKEWNEYLKPQLQASPYPVVLAGDFNDHPASYLYHQICKNLKDSFVEKGRGVGISYHGPFPAFRIDYVFHSEELEATSFKRLKSDISDHYPIVVTFKVKEGEK